MAQQAQADFVNIKVYFDNQPDKIRRTRVSTSDLKLQDLKQRLSPNDHQSIRLAYKDDEGDWITINSDEELHDAVFLYKDARDPVFRLKVFNNNCGGGSESRGQPRPQFPNFNQLPRELEQLAGILTSAFSDIQNSAYQNPILSEFLNTFNNALNHQQQQQQQHGATQSEAQDQQERRPMHHRQRCRRRGESSRCCPQRNSPAFKTAGVYMLIHRAVRLMNEGHLDEAEAQLLKARDLDPKAELVHYNLGCIDSLRGNLEQAIAHLGKAVDCGYSNSDWMLKDPDLVNLRTLSAFHHIIARAYHIQSNGNKDGATTQTEGTQGADVGIQSETETQDTESQTKDQQQPVQINAATTTTPTPAAEEQQVQYPSVSEPAPEPSVDPLEQKWKKQLDVLSDMGLDDKAKNIELLERWNGNLARVVNGALPSQ